VITERTFLDSFVDVVIYVVVGLLALLCLLPFFNVIAKSLSSFDAINVGIVRLLPVGLNFDNYGLLLRDNLFINSFVVSILRVVLAVPLTLLLCAVTAYPLSRDTLRMPGRKAFKMVLLFGMMFSGGLIPTFISYRWLDLLNRFQVLILPGAFNIFYTILLINFFRGIPHEMAESAVLDGAGHFDILFRIFLPVSLPSLATVAVFSAVGHWNSWFDGVMFLNKPELWPLQSFLFQRVMQAPTNNLRSQLTSDVAREALSFANATGEGQRAAMIVIASIPIMLVYPFLQRYFVKGLTLGAVKG
jgi:putative aldouronate transport system permease protein